MRPSPCREHNPDKSKEGSDTYSYGDFSYSMSDFVRDEYRGKAKDIEKYPCEQKFIPTPIPPLHQQLPQDRDDKGSGRPHDNVSHLFSLHKAFRSNIRMLHRFSSVPILYHTSSLPLHKNLRLV